MTTPRYEVVARMHEVEGKDQAEIARKLRISKDAVRCHLWYARHSKKSRCKRSRTAELLNELIKGVTTKEAAFNIGMKHEVAQTLASRLRAEGILKRPVFKAHVEYGHYRMKCKRQGVKPMSRGQFYAG